MNAAEKPFFRRMPQLQRYVENFKTYFIQSNCYAFANWKSYSQMEVLHFEENESSASQFSNLISILPEKFIRKISVFRIRSGIQLYPHKDYRNFALNFPLVGDFNNTPTTWYSANSPEEKTLYDDSAERAIKFNSPLDCTPIAAVSGFSPLLINTTILHGVDNSKSKVDRFTLSISGSDNISFLEAADLLNPLLSGV